MKNLILKQGDLVKMTLNDPDLGRFNFGVGQLYEVKASSIGALYVQSSIGVSVNLVDGLGQLTEYADHFAKHNCPVVLPRGLR